MTKKMVTRTLNAKCSHMTNVCE